MEFSEKLKELRKAKSLTQEELAEALYVSRTAVSKWESGRGYPSIDSLKELSRFFSVSIDELVSPDEAIAAAEDDRRAFADSLTSMVCGMLDILLVLLLLMPVFGNGAAEPSPVSLVDLACSSPWVKVVFASAVGLTILCGVCEAVAPKFERPSLNRALLLAGCALSAACVAVFIVARQPYAGILCFALLVVKLLVMYRRIAQGTAR
ncbi:MAG: helix-turn-helix transcriptional regulator [Atopobiaceae bacterium]|nr:helix-turn-helix transcriptional regulator [Eggerthellaceae bacterium]MBQ6490861.1 helix-turn-helix transcriptional regulator [Atopobiaceae bacterium]